MTTFGAEFSKVLEHAPTWLGLIGTLTGSWASWNVYKLNRSDKRRTKKKILANAEAAHAKIVDKIKQLSLPDPDAIDAFKIRENSHLLHDLREIDRTLSDDIGEVWPYAVVTLQGMQLASRRLEKISDTESVERLKLLNGCEEFNLRVSQFLTSCHVSEIESGLIDRVSRNSFLLGLEYFEKHIQYSNSALEEELSKTEMKVES